MAEIEKGLPNTRTKLEIPSDEELQEVAVQEEEQDPKGPVEVVPEIKDYTDITVDIGEEKVEKTYEDFLEEKEKAKEARKKKIQDELLKEIEEEEKSDEVDNDSTTEPSATTDISA